MRNTYYLLGSLFNSYVSWEAISVIFTWEKILQRNSNLNPDSGSFQGKDLQKRLYCIPHSVISFGEQETNYQFIYKEQTILQKENTDPVFEIILLKAEFQAGFLEQHSQFVSRTKQVKTCLFFLLFCISGLLFGDQELHLALSEWPKGCSGEGEEMFHSI